MAIIDGGKWGCRFALAVRHDGCFQDVPFYLAFAIRRSGPPVISRIEGLIDAGLRTSGVS